MQQVQTPAPPPQAPRPDFEPAATQPTGVIVTPGGQTIRMGSPSAILDAAKNVRSELRNQLARLEEQREELSDELNQNNAQPNPSAANAKGLETRIASVDQRIADVEKQLIEADASVARATAVPGSVVPPPPHPPETGPPEEFFVLTGIFMFVVLLPLSIAYARRIWRKSVGAVSALPQEIYDRFNRLDQAIDSVAIEVERVGENQRYLTKVYADQRALGAGPAERVEAVERERERQARK
jgi:hypothetical protein